MIDKRGYIFSLPSLGLPDLAGEFVSLQVAIAKRDNGVVALNAGAFDAPRRFASTSSPVIDVEYEGAVWVLPLCAPEKAAGATEVFTLQARRHPVPTVADPKRIKLPDGLGMWCVMHQDGIAAFKASTKSDAPTRTTSAPASEAEETTFWRSKFPGPLIGLGVQHLDPKIFNARWMKLETTAHPCGWLPAKGREQPPFEQPDLAAAFKSSWSSEVQAQALAEAVKAGASPDIGPPGFALQASMNSREEVIVQYACPFGDQQQRPRKHEWKTVPPRAWKPGQELKFVNQVRESYGKKPLTEIELPLARPT